MATSRHHVWLAQGNEALTTEGPWGPFSLGQAKAFARVGATEGKHDRIVTAGAGRTPRAQRLVFRYEAGTGKRVYP